MIAEAIIGHFIGDYVVQTDVLALNKKKSSLICGVHCLLWTASVMACAWTWSPWLAAWLFLTHFAIDRTQFINNWMDRVGQKGFRENLKPWSGIAVDNTFHLATILIGFKAVEFGII